MCYRPLDTCWFKFVDILVGLGEKGLDTFATFVVLQVRVVDSFMVALDRMISDECGTVVVVGI